MINDAVRPPVLIEPDCPYLPARADDLGSPDRLAPAVESDLLTPAQFRHQWSQIAGPAAVGGSPLQLPPTCQPFTGTLEVRSSPSAASGPAPAGRLDLWYSQSGCLTAVARNQLTHNPYARPVRRSPNA